MASVRLWQLRLWSLPMQGEEKTEGQTSERGEAWGQQPCGSLISTGNLLKLPKGSECKPCLPASKETRVLCSVDLLVVGHGLWASSSSGLALHTSGALLGTAPVVSVVLGMIDSLSGVSVGPPPDFGGAGQGNHYLIGTFTGGPPNPVKKLICC